MNKRNLIIAGVLIGFSAIIYILSLVMFDTDKIQPAQTENQNTESENTVPTTTAFPLDSETSNNLVESARTDFDIALNKAREWRTDASPAAVLVQYKESINPKNGKNTFVFISPSLSQFYFIYTTDQTENSFGEIRYERIIKYKEDYFLPQDIVVMPLKFWVVSFVEALKKVDDMGGKDTRAKNEKYDVNMLLSNREGGLLSWEVEYLANEEKQFGATIDAYKGEVQ